MLKYLEGRVINGPSNLTEPVNAFSFQFWFVNKYKYYFLFLTGGDFVKFLELVSSYDLEGSSETKLI